MITITNCYIVSSPLRTPPLISCDEEGSVDLNNLYITDLDQLQALEQEFGVKLKCKLAFAIDEEAAPTGYYDEDKLRALLTNKAFW